MVSLASLWIPIVVSAAIVFVASSILHMVLTYHRSDWAKLPGEDAIRAAIRAESVPPGDYFFPHCADFKEAGTEEMQAKFVEGPVGLVTIRPSGPPTMGKALAQWFGFSLVVGVFVAYVTGRTLPAGAEYLAVHRVAGTVAFMGYGLATIHESIWKGVKWSTTAKMVFDALIYGLLTGGTFGWLWPQ